MFIGNRYNFQQLKSNKFFNEIFFMNINELTIEKGSFNHGIGSLIFTDNNMQLLVNDIYDFPSNEYNVTPDNNYASENDGTRLYRIRNCLFKNIYFDKTMNFFNIQTSAMTFYMESCTFDTCSFRQCLLRIDTRANTISHICCSKLSVGSESGESLFLYSNTQADSFIKVRYSTILGTGSGIGPQGVLRFFQRNSVLCQCLNISNFNLNKDDDSTGIIRFESSKCTSFVMNTLSNLECKKIVSYNTGSNTEVQFATSMYMCNFISNSFSNCLIYLQLQASAYIEKCVFSNKEGYSKQQYFQTSLSNSAIVKVDNCIFNYNINFADGVETTNCNINTNPEFNTLAHYIVEGVCDGVNITSAAGCKNGTCPDGGCPPDDFEFNSNDYPYEDFFPGVDALPTAGFTFSLYFSYSSDFSNSNLFSDSKKFSRSGYFSSSLYFSNSKQFSETADFTRSTMFSGSVEFTKSGYFSSSFYFSDSKKFSRTGYFSSSLYFSSSKQFSETADFTRSTMFSSSFFFTNSEKFSKSEYFSETVKFTISSYFSQSTDFTESFDFTQSNEFEPTKHFDETDHFTPSRTFPPSVKFSNSFFFSQSNHFTKTDGFSNTDHFSQTDGFSRTSDFSKTVDFTNSANFLKTKEFSGTKDFSNSVEFSKTGGFSKTGMFSKSADFSQSSKFTKSDLINMAKSHGFSDSNYFTETNDFSMSFQFTESEKFSKSGDFSMSFQFTKSEKFSKSGDFSMSFQFTESEKFSKSSDFSMSFQFTEKFSKSGDFSEFSPKNPIYIEIKEDKSHGITAGMKVGIGAAAGVAALAAIVVGIIFLRRKKMVSIDNIDENIEIIEDTNSTLVSHNPLINLMSDDDPFEDEFE